MGVDQYEPRYEFLRIAIICAYDGLCFFPSVFLIFFHLFSSLLFFLGCGTVVWGGLRGLERRKGNIMFGVFICVVFVLSCFICFPFFACFSPSFFHHGLRDT
jgi:hypothetical protein